VSSSRQVARFVLLGGANTAVTGVLFYLLAGVVPARIAFTAVYVGGLIFVAALTPWLVFGARATASARGRLALWYGVLYLVGLVVVSGLESVTEIRGVVVVGTVVVTAPLGFAGARLLVGRPRSAPGDAKGAGRTVEP